MQPAAVTAFTGHAIALDQACLYAAGVPGLVVASLAYVPALWSLIGVALLLEAPLLEQRPQPAPCSPVGSCSASSAKP